MEKWAKVGDNDRSANGVTSTAAPLTPMPKEGTVADADHITTPTKSPSFQFYANDFTSGTVDLSTEDVGAYIRLLCYQWEKGAIPSDMTAQSRIAGLTTLRMRGTWGRIKRHFSDAPSGGFVNRRLERVRQGMLAYRKKQSDKGKASAANRKATAGQPECNNGSTAVNLRLQPEGNSSVFSLQSSNQKIVGGGKDDGIASDFLEQYPALYARVRSGATYAVSRLNMERDYGYALDLARGWPDVKRLLAMAEVFLRMDIGDKNRPGTVGQFLHMAPDADTQLRKNGL